MSVVVNRMQGLASEFSKNFPRMIQPSGQILMTHKFNQPCPVIIKNVMFKDMIIQRLKYVSIQHIG